MNLLRVNTLKDYGNFCLHFGLASTVSAGAFLALGVPPVLSAVALGASAAANFAFNPALRQTFQDAIDAEKARNLQGKSITELVPSADNPGLYIPERSQDLKFLGRVKSWVSDFTGKLGIKEPALLIMPPSEEEPEEKRVKKKGKKKKTEKKEENDDEDISLKDAVRDFLRNKFNEKANAFAFTHEHGNVVLNNPIANKLNERELKGVVAHEMAHLGAKHTLTSKLLSMVSTPARILTGLNALITTFSSIKNFGLVMAAGAGADYAADKIASYRGWDEDKPADEAKIKSLKSCLSNIALLGLGLFFQAPDLLLAQAIHLGTKTSLFLIGKRHSRCNEFQADRVAAELTKDPQGMSLALRKIGKLHDRPEISKPNAKGLLSGLFDTARDFDKTHPNLNRRCARLEQMAVKASGPTYGLCAP